MRTSTRDLLDERFRREYKIKIRDDAGIVTATDDFMFPGFQLLYSSLAWSHEVNLLVVDTGMSPAQREWCDRAGVRVVDFQKEDRVIDTCDSGHMVIAFNKVEYIALSPWRYTLWLDADTVVTSSLKPIFDQMEHKPFFVMDHFAPQALLYNGAALYHYLPLGPKGRRSNYAINSGICGFDMTRDAELLSRWRYCCRKAHADAKVRACIPFWDQGALLWAIEYMGLTHCIRHEKKYNSPVREIDGLTAMSKNFDDLIKMIQPGGSVIMHLLGQPKPWHEWERGIVPTESEQVDLRVPIEDKLTVFVLGHSREALDSVADKPFMRKVDLNRLDIGNHQTNALAESRIFASDLPERCGTEYIGFASSQWDRKYVGMQIAPISTLDCVRNLLQKDAVLVAMRTDNLRGPLGDFDPENWWKHVDKVHPGIEKYINEVMEISGLPRRGPSFWANNFICHRDVYRDFIGHWRMVFEELYKRHGHSYPDFECLDPSRAAAFVYEAITIHYFSSRDDLKFIELKTAILPDLEKKFTIKFGRKV